MQAARVAPAHVTARLEGAQAVRRSGRLHAHHAVGQPRGKAALVVFVTRPACLPAEFNTFHTFVVQVGRRDELQTYLAAHGIGTAIHYPVPIHLQPAAADLGYGVGDFPVAEYQASRILSLPVALGSAALTMVLAWLVPVREMYDHIDWPVIVLLGAMIPVGQALEVSGTTHMIASGLVTLSADLPPVVLLTVILVVTMTLSDVINNAATAVVMAPIALTIAQQLGVNPDAFLMAVAIGCAEWTPNFLASYEADDTTPLSLLPPTITGLPLNSGLSSTSTEG